MEPQNKPQTKEFKKIFNPHTKITAKANGKKDAMRNQNNLPINNVPDSNQKQDVKIKLDFKIFIKCI